MKLLNNLLRRYLVWKIKRRIRTLEIREILSDPRTKMYYLPDGVIHLRRPEGDDEDE